MITASTMPPRASIHGRSAREATLPIDVEPPSKRTSAPLDSIAIAVPSPIANTVHSKCGRSSRTDRAIGGRNTRAAAVAAATTRVRRPRDRTDPQPATASAAPSDQCAPPSAIDPAPHLIASSTSSIWSIAANQAGHASTTVSGGQRAPSTAFGYASMSVAVDSGAHASVSKVPTGWIEPKWTSTIGVLAMNAARPAATARARNSPAIPSNAGRPGIGASPGIHRSQRACTGIDRCRSASTHAKLSWNPGFRASDGADSSMTIAATASTASPFHSRPTAEPEAPTIAISAERTALAAGAMRSSAQHAAIPHATACTLGLGETSRAASPTSQPSTARLKPEMARMCERPTARKEFSIAR